MPQSDDSEFCAKHPHWKMTETEVTHGGHTSRVLICGACEWEADTRSGK